jgi:hypothetical protein
MLLLSNPISRHIFGKIVQGVLVRAIHYSLTLRGFDTDCRNIRLTLLYTMGLSISFILFFAIYLYQHLPIRQNLSMLSSINSFQTMIC